MPGLGDPTGTRLVPGQTYTLVWSTLWFPDLQSAIGYVASTLDKLNRSLAALGCVVERPANTATGDH